MPTPLRNVRSRGQSGKHLLALSFSGFDPGCVKTCTSSECAELLSLFSSFGGDCQSGSFVIQRNRDKTSTRKFDVGVFTQPGTQLRHWSRPAAVLLIAVLALSTDLFEALRCHLLSLGLAM